MKRYTNSSFDAGHALWENRKSLRLTQPRLTTLAHAIGRLSDSGLSQYAQLFAMTMEFKPSLILEVGRAYGNSTAVFTESANHLPDTRVVSICLTDIWQKRIRGEVEQIVEPTWFNKLETFTMDFLHAPLHQIIKPSDSVLFFWDAHGWDIAEFILGGVLPILATHRHLVLVHDIMDIRYHPHLKKYTRNGIWKNYLGDEVKKQNNVVIRNMASSFEEMVALNDFAERNELTIHSVEHQVQEVIFRSAYKRVQMRQILGEEMSRSTSSIHWFSLNTGKKKSFFFPPYQPNVQSITKKTFTPALRSAPLVSIVTPSFNNARYLTECIKSVLSQNYPKVEHIIQDRCSTDGTIAILKKYSKGTYKNRVKWVSEPDNGQSDGLNKALQRAKGDILLVLNADDALMPTACSWGVEQLKKNPDCAAVYGDEYFFDENSKIFDHYIGKYPYLYERLFCVELVPPAQAAFIRRSMLETVGFFADSTLKTCPDYEMWVRLGARFPMKHEFGVVCKYRHHAQSEGQRPDVTPKMVVAKKSVIDKTLADPKTSKHIKLLRNRAYAGLYHWGSNVAGSVGLYRYELYCLVRSIYYRPQLHKFIRLFRFMMRHSIGYTKLNFFRFINKLDIKTLL